MREPDLPPPGELSLEEFNAVFSDPLFRHIEYVNINGGEPNLRDDLSQLAGLFIDKFPRLRTITINSNGLPFARAVSNAERISRLARENGIRLSISVSLHKIGPGYDEIAGVDNAYSRVIRTLRALREMRDRGLFYLGVNCVVTNLNVFDLDQMLEWSRRERIPANFTFAEVRDRFNNRKMRGAIELRNDGREALIRFCRRLGEKKSLFNQHAFRYRELAGMLESGKPRTISCHYAMGSLILGSEGSLYYCPKSKSLGDCRKRSAFEIFYDRGNLKYRRDILLQATCPGCPPYTFNRFELEKDLLKYAGFLLFDV